MTTNSARDAIYSAESPNADKLSRWQKIAPYVEMPPAELSNLPEKILALTGIPYWPIASLAVGVGLYLLFLLLAFSDGFIYQLSTPRAWWATLAFPVTGTYLLVIQAFIRFLLTHTLDQYRDIAPANDRLRRLEAKTYTLSRRGQIIAIGIGTLLGWVLLDPPPLRGQYYSLTIYAILGDVLVFGLMGWHTYAALARTKILSVMYDQIQNLNAFKQPAPFKPIFQWSVISAGILLSGVIVSVIFLPPEEIGNPVTIMLYGALALAGMLIMAFSKAPASLLSRFRVFRAVYLFVIVAIIGTIGFSQLENWHPLEAFYVTIITMTTIGYGDFSPATVSGRVFTIFLSLFAIGIGGYAVTSIAAFIIEGNFSRFIQGKRVDKQIVEMNNHYILCGAGRLGRQLAIEFYKSQVPFVVIEQNPETLERLLRESDIPYVQGDATHDEALKLAGVERAKGLVATLRDDKDNVFISLSARSLNPSLQIVSKVTLEKNRKKLEKAGANLIISPEVISGRRMANEMLHSEVITLLDEMLVAEQQTGQILRLEEIHVDEIKIPALQEQLNDGELHIADIGQRTELMVVAIKRGQHSKNEDPYIYTPRGNTVLQQGDILIVIGTPEQRLKLQHDVLSKENSENWLLNLWT